ncbi:MAG TPA: STAS domain-containing protein [Ilumatobacteraceae bacterium]
MCYDALDVEITRVDRLAVVTVQGEVDIHTVFTLSAALSEIDLDTFVWIDLEHVGFMDSSGLDVLALHAARLRDAGGSLVIAKVSPIVRRVVEVVGLTHLLDAFGNDIEEQFEKPRYGRFEHEVAGAGSGQITGTARVPLAPVSTPRPAGLLRSPVYARRRPEAITPTQLRPWPRPFTAD